MITKNHDLPVRQYGISMSILKTSRVSGAMFLLSLLVPIINWVFVLSKLISPENTITTVQNILNNEFLFKLNIINQILSAIIILLLTNMLFAILNKTDRNLSILAFSFRYIEVILIIVIALIHYVILFVLKGENNFSNLHQEYLYAIVRAFIDNYVNITTIFGIFFGLSMMIFSYLFFKSRLIPPQLALFGILAYMLVFIYDSAIIIFPSLTNLLFQIIGTAPVCIFQITIGIWLISKGIQLYKQPNK